MYNQSAEIYCGFAKPHYDKQYKPTKNSHEHTSSTTSLNLSASVKKNNNNGVSIPQDANKKI